MYSQVFKFIEMEQKRQDSNIELIASENFVSDNVLKAMGSIFTNKYAEGYASRRLDGTGNTGRYYGGCENVDALEEYCIQLWKKVFRTDYHVNVQPWSGSQANMEAYAAFIKPGMTILSMDLNSGGHLSHGSSVSQVGKLYNILSYGVTRDGYIDYVDFAEKILFNKPDLILAGASAYPRTIDFEKIYDMIQYAKFTLKDDTYNPIFMVDMAHIAGLVATGYHPSPFGFANVITTTTHKTLRGPRGGIIFCKPEYSKKVDSAVFPGSQGGANFATIAAKAVCAEEALDPSFTEYIGRVVRCSKTMANEFSKMGYKVITGGTDNHLFLLDFSDTHPNITGAMVQDTLDEYGITLNKNCVPGEKRSPKEASGVRIGTAPMCSRGWTEKQFIDTAHHINDIISELNNSNCAKKDFCDI